MDASPGQRQGEHEATRWAACSGPVHRFRLLASVVVITASLLALAVRLYFIQVVRHEEYLESANRMRRSVETILAYRGDIRFSDGVIGGRDLLDFEVGLDPKFLPGDKLPEIVRLVCDAVGKSAEYRRERLIVALKKQEEGGEYVRLATEVSEPRMAEIRGAVERILAPREMKGFVVEPRARRTYPRETLASAVIGVTDASGKGIEGLEKSMESYLSRADGRREVFKDAVQKTRIFTVGNLEVAPVGGYNVYLTIQTAIQSIVEEELEAGIRREKAEGGCMIVLDCNTGNILAMASYPPYDPNRFGDYPDVERKRRRANKAVENLYEPGSVIKAFFASFALEMGICRRDQLMRALVPPQMSWDGGRHATVGRRLITDVHEHEGMRFEDAIIHSSNIGFSILGLKLGKAGIMDGLARFGLDRPTGIELPAEESWKPWAPPMKWNPLMSPVSAAFGYEVMVTPLQLCRAFAAVVNGGYLLRPRLIDRIVKGDEVTTSPSRVVEGRPISEETSRSMREILKRVVEEGTAKWLKIEGFDFGGKTGTSDMAHAGGYAKKDYLASFEAFAPFENPRIVAFCMIEKPHGRSIYGGVVAGPVVAEVFRRLFKVTAETKLAMIQKTLKG